ncbi:hypothetical protein BGX23_010801 [Mortierella sp. AD031]|nr:hypothetical protein BGX23_010801 [Mortierella sp. AD031]KAG0207387.1 hypothetical protein BGX33_006841 [Mortierella sp. NVP41]
MDDVVLSESSLFWALRIVPTRFDGYFCESVTRIYESDLEPCARQDHCWKCSVTENMINGVATIDLVIQRIPIEYSSRFSSSSAQPENKNNDEDDDKEEGEREEEGESSAAGSSRGEQKQRQSHQQQEQRHGQHKHQEQEQEQEQQREQDQQAQTGQSSQGQAEIPSRIHYKTIALHTPKTLAPLMSMFFDSNSSGETPIRGKS